MKIYFNTNTFDSFIENSGLDITTDCKEAEFLILGTKKPEYKEFSNLKAVYRFGVGVENVDFKYLESKNIPVYFPSDNVKAILYEATANFTVMGILNVLFKDIKGDPDKWKKVKRDFIGDKTALVIGIGNIGKRVAEKLKVFMKVETYDSLTDKEESFIPRLKQADIVTIHIPLNEATKDFFDAEKLSVIKNTALLINTSRGALYNEEALKEKLEKSDCRAFFDVFWKEPYNGILKKFGPEKFFMTPHSASNTKDFIIAGFNEILDINAGRIK